MNSGELPYPPRIESKKMSYPLIGSESHHLIDQSPLNDPQKKLIIDQILETNRGKPGAIMIILNEIQSQLSYISQPVQEYVAQELNVPPSTIHGVVTFYSFFTTTPRGRHTVKFCMGTACYVGGTPQLIQKAKQIFEIGPGETTADENVSLEVCRCVGSCSQAPVVVVDEQVYGRVRPSRFTQLINKALKEPES